MINAVYVQTNHTDDSIVYQRRINGRLKLSCSVVNIMKEHTENILEAGGVLLGRFIIETDDIVVDHVTVPMPGDIQKPCCFFKKSERHQQIIDQFWQESKGTCNYLGEWHTHPRFEPWPSVIDINDWTRKLKENQFSGETLFFVIIGSYEIRAWEGDKNDLTLEPLQRITVST